MAQHPRAFLARRPLSGAQDRLKAIPAARRVEDTELLPAVPEVCRVIDVQHDLRRRAGEAVAKGIDHAQPHPGQHPPAGRILQPRQGWLSGQPHIGLRRLLAAHLQRRIVTQHITVLMSARNRANAGIDHRGIAVDHRRRITRVADTSGQHCRQIKAPAWHAAAAPCHSSSSRRRRTLRGCRGRKQVTDRTGSGYRRTWRAGNSV